LRGASRNSKNPGEPHTTEKNREKKRKKKRMVRTKPPPSRRVPDETRSNKFPGDVPEQGRGYPELRVDLSRKTRQNGGCSKKEPQTGSQASVHGLEAGGGTKPSGHEKICEKIQESRAQVELPRLEPWSKIQFDTSGLAARESKTKKRTALGAGALGGTPSKDRKAGGKKVKKGNENKHTGWTLVTLQLDWKWLRKV